jgi:uncharacterized membrane protein
MNFITFITFLLISITGINAEKRLYSNSLVNCMVNNSDIIPNYFNVVFDAETRSINYDISLTAKIQGKLKAYATVYAFGFDILHEIIDLCDLNLKQFCPITPSHMEVQAIEYISQEYVNKVPGIAYTFPNLDAVARLIIVDENNAILGCLQASFDNGKRVSHEGAKWATAVIAGLGLLVSGVLSLFGNSASASRMAAAALSLFTYFQSVVIIAMISVEEVPPIANDWAENLAWSMGLIYIEFMQSIFRWYVQATGGTPTQYLTSGVKSILTQRSIQSLFQSSIVQKIGSFFFPTLNSPINYNDFGLETRSINSDSNSKYFIPMNHVLSNDYLLVLRGIERIGFDSNIEPSAIVVTGFTFFILCLYVLVGVFFIYRYLNHVLSKSNKQTWLNKKLDHRTNWKPTFKGMLSRYIFIGFPQLLILSLWEFTRNDSGAVVTIAVFFFILALGTMGLCAFQVLRYGSKSVAEHGNPAAILYGNPEILNRYGFLYTMLNANKYWFCAVSLSYLFVKCFFVALAQESGKTQAMAIWILDMFYLGLMCHFLPYLDKFTNVLSVFIQLITTINSFFFTFFSGVYNQPPKVASVMGLIFFIMNAAVSLILLITILVLAVFTIFVKNPDARFSPTKDDRTSFQRKHQSMVNQFDDETNELFALGAVAKDHGNNWENDMYNLRDINDKSSSGDDQIDNEVKNSEAKSISNELSEDSNHGGFSGFVGKLTRGRSLLGRKQKKPDIQLETPENLFHEKSNNLNNPDLLNIDTSSETEIQRPTIPIDDNNNYKGEIESDPFKSKIEDPFRNPMPVPYNHARHESHISGITNDTTGLSVFGERINSSDYINDQISEDNHNGVGIQNLSGLNHSQLPVHEEGDYMDGIDSEESDPAKRRFK